MPFHMRMRNLRADYALLLQEVHRRGVRVQSRGYEAREVTGAQLVFTDPLAPLLPIGVGRGVNLRLAAVEALQVIAGESRSHMIRRAAPTFENVLVDPSDLDYGAYGPRLAYAIGDCLDLLRADPDSRQAVAAIWKPDDLEHSGDKPCTVFLQFLTRANDAGDRTLELYAYMRSQDAWLGVPYDVFTFSQLQHTMARELKLPAGLYVHNVTSLHLYERDVASAERVFGESGRVVGSDDELNLPLGVVGSDDATGFEVASYLLDEGDDEALPNASEHERAANGWFTLQMDSLKRLPKPA